ncbi:MAG: hypothetical protein AAGJ54_03925 [Planctomycetota bacterium]
MIVEHVYPTADELPENLLRFYIYFSKPMRPDTASRSILLADEDGNEIDGAFLDTSDGLWSSDRRRLTVLLNPGRIKSGLEASTAMGPAIKEGGRYSVEIAADAEAMDGSMLAEPYVKIFEVLGPDRRSPRPERWTLSEPRLGSLDPLTVLLDESVDHASLAYRIRVVDALGGVVPGRVAIQQQEQRWVFTPGESWAAGDYALRVDHKLEDLAGNRPDRLFEQRDRNAPRAAAHQIPIRTVPISK